MKTDPEYAYLDGNAAAGALQELFAIEVTAMTAECSGCGALAALAQERVYAQSPGLVVRCDSCDGVMLRLVQSSDRSWLEVSGVRLFTFASG